ncbi:MAG: hypothetical protein J6K01_00220 [Paludibacteraceae bacterium]|nr:hypothetical protein [Paludibacteraceae bacterium]
MEGFDGTDVITVRENGHKVIYLIDHTDNKSFEEIYDNLSREEKDECIAGYGITGKFNIDKITKNDIRRILERISSDYGHSEERIREVLQNLGIRPEILSGIDVAAELKMVSGANVVMDATGGGERTETRHNGSSEYGKENKGGRETKGENEGLDLSGVQLMEGSDGTVYGWCEIERDAEGNVVARHIYLNDEVLNANTMVHEMGHLWLNLLSEVNHFNEIIMKVSKRCEEMIARYAELNGAKLVKSEDFANKILNGMEISQGKFDALVSYTYRVGENTAKNLIEKVAANPVGNFSSLFVKDIAMDAVRWGKEEVNLFENM